MEALRGFVLGPRVGTAWLAIAAAGAVACGAKTELDTPTLSPAECWRAERAAMRLDPAAACRWQPGTPTLVTRDRVSGVSSTAQRSAHGAVVAWRGTDAFHTRAIAANGAPSGDEVRLPFAQGDAGATVVSRTTLGLAATCDGFLAAGGDNARGCEFYRLDVDGRPLEGRVLDPAALCLDPLTTPDGFWMPFWSVDLTPAGVGIYDRDGGLVRRFDVSSNDQYGQSWAALDDGDVVFASPNSAASSGAGNFLARFDPQGLPTGTSPVASTPGTLVQGLRVFPTSEGLLAAWIEPFTGGALGTALRVQAFGPDLSPRGNATDVGHGAMDARLGVARGIPLIVWSDSSGRLFLQALTADARLQGAAVPLPPPMQSLAAGSAGALLDVPDGALLVVDANVNDTWSLLLRCEAP